MSDDKVKRRTKRPASAYCQNCTARLSVDGWKIGMEEGADSKAENLKCGCRYCWHCSDNRGRHEDHDEHCAGPVVPVIWRQQFAKKPEDEYE